MSYQKVLELDSQRQVIAGDVTKLNEAIGRGADLRIYTEFNFEEHIEPGSPNRELVKEVSDFRVSYLVDGQWSAAIMNLRMPVHPPMGFGPRPSWSYFMYNQDGSQAIARLFLDQIPAKAPCGACPAHGPENMPKYHVIDNYDDQSNGPCSNFIYDFERFDFFVRDDWREVFAHDATGGVVRGSFDELMDCFTSGMDLKAGVGDLFCEEGDLPYELFTHCGPGYYNTKSRVFCMSSQPTVLVKPAMPMRYQSGNWSSGSLLFRTDGEIEYWCCDPYTMQYEKIRTRAPIRYFVR